MAGQEWPLACSGSITSIGGECHDLLISSVGGMLYLEAAREQQGGPREAGSRLQAELHVSSAAGLMVGFGPLRSTAARDSDN